MNADELGLRNGATQQQLSYPTVRARRPARGMSIASIALSVLAATAWLCLPLGKPLLVCLVSSSATAVGLALTAGVSAVAERRRGAWLALFALLVAASGLLLVLSPGLLPLVDLWLRDRHHS